MATTPWIPSHPEQLDIERELLSKYPMIPPTVIRNYTMPSEVRQIRADMMYSRTYHPYYPPWYEQVVTFLLFVLEAEDG